MMMKWIKAKLGLEKESARLVNGQPPEMIPEGCVVSRQEAKTRLRWFLLGSHAVEVTGVGLGAGNVLNVYLAKEDPELREKIVSAARLAASGYVINFEVTGPIRAL